MDRKIICGCLLAATCLWMGACSNNGEKTKHNTDGSLSSQGVCTDTCPKECTGDTDCDTAKGELCCGFADDGNICTPAAQCPRFCADDTRCDTSNGEACIRMTLTSAKKVCQEPTKAVKLCSSDSACDSSMGETCCSIYKEPICLPASRCPKTCATSSQCDTQNSEICCKTMGLLDPTLQNGGICLDTTRVPCPKACAASGDCDTASGELCCDGICSTACAKRCDTSNDCKNQICCKASAARSPWFGKVKPQLGYDACSCSGGDVKCDGSGGLKTCDGCSWQPTSCDSKCKLSGYTSGKCVDSYSTAYCDCSYDPPTDPYSNPMQGFGDLCDASAPCGSGLQCVSFSSGATKGVCTKTCSSVGSTCSGAPSGTYALCGFTAGSVDVCGFICSMNGSTYSCPSYQFSCEVFDTSQPSIKVCVPK